jgi:hypothetical protein
MKQLLDTPAGCFASKSKILHVVIERGANGKVVELVLKPLP